MSQHSTADPTCALCGQTFPADAVVQINATTVCAACKPVYLQRLREGVSAPGTPRFAGFWIRALATLVDALVLQAAAMGMRMATGLTLAEAAGFGSAEWTRRDTVWFGVDTLVALGYQAIFVARFGGTPGKLLCRLRVVADGQPLTFARSLGRALAMYVSALPCGLGFVMAAFDSQKRTLHDRICQTRVIRMK